MAEGIPSVAPQGQTGDELRCLTLHQPWASLVAQGVKRIETRGRRTHYRGWLAIHAGKRRPFNLTTVTECPRVGRWVVDWGLHPDLSVITNGFDDGTGYVLVEREDGTSGPEDCLDYIPLHLGAVVAVARLTDCVPMVEYHQAWPHPYLMVDHGLLVHSGEPGDSTRITDQLPYGIYEPGRWAWILDDIHPLPEPVPAKGKQGLWRPDAGLAAAIAGQMPEVAS